MDTDPCTPGARPLRQHSWSLGHVLVPLGAVLSLFPFVSTGVALVAGVLVAMGVGNPFVALTRRVTPTLLALAVVGLGAGMDLRVVAAVGVQGIGYTVVGIAACLVLGTLLTRALGVSREAG